MSEKICLYKNKQKISSAHRSLGIVQIRSAFDSMAIFSLCFASRPRDVFNIAVAVASILRNGIFP